MSFVFMSAFCASCISAYRGDDAKTVLIATFHGASIGMLIQIFSLVEDDHKTGVRFSGLRNMFGGLFDAKK
jgi:hypothetical protein